MIGKAQQRDKSEDLPLHVISSAGLRTMVIKQNLLFFVLPRAGILRDCCRYTVPYLLLHLCIYVSVCVYLDIWTIVQTIILFKTIILGRFYKLALSYIISIVP